MLLAGATRPSTLTRAAGRSLLDLPVSGSQSMMETWVRQFASLRDWMDAGDLEVRVLIDESSPPPTVKPNTGVPVRVETDPRPYRGTGGVLHDASERYDDDDLILVANGFQLLNEPLPNLMANLLSADEDVALIAPSASADLTPVSLMLVARRALRGISPIGFVDFKEQALPSIAREYRVAIVRRNGGAGMSIRTLYDYVSTLRRHYGGERPDAEHDAFAEDWQTGFAVIEQGAEVDPTARLHDSVVLGGGVVRHGATLIRSVVCAGGVVARGRSVVDQLVV